MPEHPKMAEAIPDYRNLDLSGEALQAAARMEARGNEPASQEMFLQLFAPLLTGQVKTICEFGCGTAALSRKIARVVPGSQIYASDKSEGMLHAAQKLLEREQISNIQLLQWDVLDENAWPMPVEKVDLILSSVVIPYLDDDQAIGFIKRLSARLVPGGILAFIEQDWMTDTVNFPQYALIRKVLAKDLREYKRTLALGLRPFLRESGLNLLPRRSFLWTDDAYGPYTRDLLERFADSACDQGRVTSAERDAWKQELNTLAESGDFFYGIVYHQVAGQQPANQ